MKPFAPILLVVLFAWCGIESAINKKWNDCIYSFAACILNVAVYFKPFN